MTPIPGSGEYCRHISCGRIVIVGQDAVPARKVTGNPRSRGFYCPACWERLKGRK